jgi:glycosyltransferase involved in cell wall biosynthesis
MKDALTPPSPHGPLRVLVASYRSNPHTGGQGIYVRALAKALMEAGCAVTVVSGPPYPELDDGVALEQLPSLDLFAEANAFLTLRAGTLFNTADRIEWLAHNTGAFAEMFSFAWRLDQFVRENAGRFDVVHDNQTLAPAMARIDRVLPVITTLHHPIAIDRDFAIAGAANWWRRALTARWHSFVDVQARAARRLPRFLAVSAAGRDSYAARCGIDPSRVTVSLNGVDQDRFSPDRSVSREGDHIVTLASADVPIKGLDVLIDALALLKDRGREPRLTVIGSLRDGPAKRALERTGVISQVTFRSGLSDAELVDLYRRAGVFVSASRFEGFGLPAAEAMATGAPVVVSDGGALPEVAGDAGIVVPAGQAAPLADALERVLGDDALRLSMGEASVKRAQDQFRWDKHAGAAINLYHEALEARAPA